MNVKKYLKVVLTLLLVVLAAWGGVSVARFMTNPLLDETTVPHDPVDTENGHVKFNMLIMGLDKDHTRTDTIMLANYNQDKGSISIMSIPRDTWVKYPDGGEGMINAAYSRKISVTENGETVKRVGKEDATIQVVKEITGVPIQYYVTFTFEDFRKVIDALGGVEYEVRPQGYKYDDPAQDLHINIPGGLQVLDGKAAEGLVRYRHDYARADLERVEVQQDFLKELVNQKLSAKYITKIPEIYNLVSDSVRCNMGVKDMVKYGNMIMKTGTENMHSFTMPNSPMGNRVKINTEALDDMIEQYFGYDGPLDDSDLK